MVTFGFNRTALQATQRKLHLIFCAIDALKDNIREAIDKKQLHSIDIKLKNWIDRVAYCLAYRGSHLNEIIFHY